MERCLWCSNPFYDPANLFCSSDCMEDYYEEHAFNLAQEREYMLAIEERTKNHKEN